MEYSLLGEGASALRRKDVLLTSVGFGLMPYFTPLINLARISSTALYATDAPFADFKPAPLQHAGVHVRVRGPHSPAQGRSSRSNIREYALRLLSPCAKGQAIRLSAIRAFKGIFVIRSQLGIL